YVAHLLNYFFCIQDRVIPASLSETRSLLTIRWEVAIAFELHSTLWVDPESRSFLAVQDDGRWEIRYSRTQLFGLYLRLGHSSEFKRD
ncbi:hypothetical protein ACPV4H_22695, partial [Vibrio rotiferianus]|uniref:hypothetical protein n=1 Tax=Vibrio rotiferianus TaxID=190895 RepID=UPI00406A3229